MNRKILFHFFLLMPNNSSLLIKNKAVSLRSSIKASIAQLDQWDALQAKQQEKSPGCKNRFRSFADRLAIAKHGAKQSFPSIPSDPLCDRCESSFHSTKEDCNISDTLEALEREDQLESTSRSPQVVVHEDPSTGIHLVIVNRLYLNICELYLNNHPRYYTGPKPTKTEPQVFDPVPLSRPDYLATIAVRQASIDFQGTAVDLSDIHKHHVLLFSHLPFVLHQGFSA